MIFFKQHEIGEVLQRIYDSEINFKIDTFWDSGFSFQLGLEMTGYTNPKEFRTLEEDEQTQWTKIEDVVSYLAFAITKIFPNSVFTEWYKTFDEIKFGAKCKVYYDGHLVNATVSCVGDISYDVTIDELGFEMKSIERDIWRPI